MKRLQAFILFLFSAVAYSRTPPDCLADLCIGERPLTEKRIKDRFGTDSKHKTRLDKSAYCFRFVTEGHKPYYGHFVHADPRAYDISSIMRISSEEICTDYKEIKYGNEARTKEGTAIGDTIEKVLETYGKPSKISKPPKDWEYKDIFGSKSKLKLDSILKYYPKEELDLLAAQFYISDGFVMAIEISRVP